MRNFFYVFLRLFKGTAEYTMMRGIQNCIWWSQKCLEWKVILGWGKPGSNRNQLYTCVSFFGAEMTENNYYRTSNTPKNQKNGLEWHVWASNKWCFGALGTLQRHTCVAQSIFFPTHYQTLSIKEFKFTFDEKRVPICFY